MRKELRPVHDLIACDLCQRTILKGEGIETFIGGGDRQRVCELCSGRALRSGWMREAELERQVPDREHLHPPASLWSRALTWAEEQGLWGAPPPSAEEDEAGSHSATPPPATAQSSLPAEPAPRPAPAAPLDHDGSATETDASRQAPDERRRRAAARAEERRQARRMQAERESEDPDGGDVASVAHRPSRAPNPAGLRDLISGRRREPRQVQAVPSGRWAKIELALKLFNDSEHRRTVAGVGRTLGEPWASAAPLGDDPATREVGIIVAWELSWYRFRVDLDDVDEAVLLVDRGNELEDLDESLRTWNVGADAEGRLALAVEAVS
jgi:hypothetical protein